MKATTITVSLAALAFCSSCVGEMKKSTSAQPEDNNQTSVTTPANNQSPNNQTTVANNQTSPPANNQTTPPPDPDYIERVGSIELTANIPTLTVGQGTALSVTILDKEGNPMELVSLMWSTSDAEVATADGTGIVRAIGVGEAEISASIGEVTSNTIALTVAPAPPRQDPVLRVSPARIGLSVGDVLPLAVEVRRGAIEEVANELITWKVENESIATVDEEGHLTAVAVGATTATATYEGATSSPISVLITDTPDYYAVDVDNPTGHVNVGGALTIQASFKSYATGDKPGFGVPYQPEQVELIEGEQVLGTITPGYGLAVGEVDLSGLSDGAHELQLRATISGQTVLSPSFTVSKLQPVMDYWQDFAPNDPVRGQDARLF
ncbi:MAG: Ig-like domain-containing protein, partial [Myxococcota bacterium]|nr:Ig-like domain-containing protein [Myxococcota bacterium]